jgi:hypothetical protein
MRMQTEMRGHRPPPTHLTFACSSCAGGSASQGDASEVTIFQYEMPSDGSYALQQVAAFFLPVTGGTGPDIAPGSTILWMAVNNKARHRCGIQLHGCCRLVYGVGGLVPG